MRFCVLATHEGTGLPAYSRLSLAKGIPTDFHSQIYQVASTLVLLAGCPAWVCNPSLLREEPLQLRDPSGVRIAAQECETIPFLLCPSYQSPCGYSWKFLVISLLFS